MDSSNIFSQFIFIGLFVGVFVVLLWGILFSLSRLGGWSKWAKIYGHENVEAVVKLTWANGYMKFPAKYGNTLTLGVNEDGLILATIAWFKPFHKTLVLPWDDIHIKWTRIFFSEVVEVTLQRVPGVSIKLYPRELKRLGEILQKKSPGLFEKFASLFFK